MKGDILLQEGNWGLKSDGKNKQSCRYHLVCDDTSQKNVIIYQRDTRCSLCKKSVPERIQTAWVLHNMDRLFKDD